MRRLKDVWLKYTCILKGCMIAIKLVGHNIYLWIMWRHLNFLDDNVVVHNIYGSSHQTESAQLAWSWVPVQCNVSWSAGDSSLHYRVWYVGKYFVTLKAPNGPRFIGTDVQTTINHMRFIMLRAYLMCIWKYVMYVHLCSYNNMYHFGFLKCANWMYECYLQCDIISVCWKEWSSGEH